MHAAPHATAGGSPAVVTLFAKNYLAHVRVLAESLRRWHPEVAFFGVLIDDARGCFDPAREAFAIVPLAPPPSTRSIKEAATAAKPAALRLALDRGHASAIFFDPDVLVRASLDALFATVQTHAITLMPHLTAPPAADAETRELNIIQSGTLNGGFVGVTESPSAREFLDWWSDRVAQRCDYDVAGGVYYDQRWLDLAPAFFDDVFLVRDPSYNVAHWNLPERDLVAARFAHFSGFDPDRVDRVTAYHQRVAMASLGAGAVLFREYASLLKRAGYDEAKRWVPARRRRDRSPA